MSHRGGHSRISLEPEGRSVVRIVLNAVMHTDRHWSKYCGQEDADSSPLKEDRTRISIVEKYKRRFRMSPLVILSAAHENPLKIPVSDRMWQASVCVGGSC